MTRGSSADLHRLVGDETYAGRVIQTIATVAWAPSPAEALEVLHSAKEKMGVEQAVFVDFIRGDDSHENYRFMLAADPRWCFEYQAKAWYGSDPWLLYAATNSEPTCASQITSLTAQQRDVQLLAKKYGMTSVCIAPAPSCGSNARVGMLALGSSQPGFFENESFPVFKVLARSLAAELHAWWTRFEREDLIKRLHITDEDMQLLRLEVRGAGTKKVAEELGTTVPAVNSRWQRLNGKLSSPHRQSAARLALRYGLI